jgi:hypothetical protein
MSELTERLKDAAAVTHEQLVAAWNERDWGTLPDEVANSLDWRRAFVAYLAFPNHWQRFLAMLDETERVLAIRHHPRTTTFHLNQGALTCPTHAP